MSIGSVVVSGTRDLRDASDAGVGERVTGPSQVVSRRRYPRCMYLVGSAPGTQVKKNHPRVDWSGGSCGQAVQGRGAHPGEVGAAPGLVASGQVLQGNRRAARPIRGALVLAAAPLATAAVNTFPGMMAFCCVWQPRRPLEL